MKKIAKVIRARAQRIDAKTMKSAEVESNIAGKKNKNTANNRKIIQNKRYGLSEVLTCILWSLPILGNNAILFNIAPIFFD